MRRAPLVKTNSATLTAIRDEIWPHYIEFNNEIIDLATSVIARGQREGSIARDVDARETARLAIGSAHMIAQMKFAERSPEK
jgi:hypothetical protein